MKTKITPFNWRAELKNSYIDSIGEDFIMIEDPTFLSTIDYPFKLDIFIAMITVKGILKVSVNLKDYTIQQSSLFMVMAEQIIQFKSISEDFSGQFIFMSNNFLSNLLAGPKERLPIFLSVYNEPSLSLDDDGFNSLNMYYKMIQNEIRKEENPYRLETVKHLSQALFYGTVYQYHKTPETGEKTKHEVLMQDFMNLVNIHYKEHREAGFYADILNLTPKYLSKIIKANSGKSANNWIDDYVILEAKALLKSTNMNVQQISDHLNFPTQSFFGKYFKRHVGISPKEYKKN